MKSRLIKILLTAAALFAALLLTAGCASAQVKLNRDGSGSVTLSIAREEGVTEESVNRKLEEIIAGAGAMSGDDDRIKLKSLKESPDGFEAVLSFKRIQYTKGIGEFNYMPSGEFLQELNKTALIQYWAAGKYRDFQNYNESIYRFANGTSGDESLAFRPVTAGGEQIAPADFISRTGMLAGSDRGRMFTFFLADLQGLESVTFSFSGKIKAYGSKNAELVDDSTLRVTPVEADALILSGEGGASAESRAVSCFVGYVYFELGVNPVLVGCCVGGGALLLGFLIYGFASGLFKRVFRGRVFRSILRNYDLYLMLIPALGLLALFSYLPMGGIVMAFKNFRITDGIWGSEWTSMAGFKHFWELLTEPTSDFGALARNTVILAMLKFVFGFVCAILLAVLFSYLKNGLFKRSVQTISYFPYFVSWVTISGIAYLFLATDGGVLNQVLTALGASPVRWYSSPQYWRTILTFTSIWKTVGYSTIIYLAAITAINPSLYEAAMIDGGGRWKQLLHITIPGMFPVIGIQIIFSLGNLVRDDFDQIYTMVGGNNASLSSTTEVIGTIVYKSIGNVSSYSSAAAMGLMQGLAALLLVLFSNKIVKRMGLEGVY